MEYILPDKSLLNKKNEGLEGCFYSLSKLIYKKDFKDKLVIPIGIDNQKEKYYMDLKNVSSILVGGETGSGKSMFLNSIIISILLKNNPDEVKFLFIDPSKVELGVYNGLPHMLLDNAYTFDKSLDRLSIVKCLIEARKEILLAASCKNIEGYNKKNDKKLAHILVVIDDSIEILTKDETIDVIREVLLNGHLFGIHLIFATGVYLKDFLEPKYIDLFSYIISFDQASAEQAEFLKLDNSNLLTIAGDALIKCRDNEIINLQTPYISSSEIKNVVNFILEQK